MADDSLVFEALRRGLITEDEARAKLAGMEHAPAAKPPSVDLVDNSVTRGVASTGTGILHGMAGLGGMFSDLLNLGKPDSLPKFRGGSEDIKQAAQNIFSQTPYGDLPPLTAYQPKTTGEKYAKAFGETATAMVPGNWKQALIGGVAGLGGEAAANNSEHPELARLAGQAAVLGPTALFSMRTPDTVKAVKSYVSELGPEGLRAADAMRKQAAATLDTPTLLTQGSPQDELSGVVRALVNSPEGGKVRQVLRDQIPAGERAVRGTYEGIPGGAGQDQADAVLRVAQAAQQAPRDFRSSITRPFYEAAKNDTVDPAPIAAAIAKARIDLSIPAAVPPGKAMRTLQDMIDSASGKQVPVLELDKVSQMAKDAARQAQLKGNTTKVLANRAVADAIDTVIEGASPALARGKAEHGLMAESLVNPVDQTVGQLITPEMLKTGKGDWSKFQAVVDNATPDEITALGTHLRRVGPEAFPNIVKNSLRDAAETALTPSAGRTPDTAFNRFANEVAGPKGSTKREAFEAKMTQVALAQGRDPADVVRGANDAIDALYVISRDRGTASSGAESMNQAAQNWFTRLLRAASFTAPARGAGYALELAASKRLSRDLSEAFTSPDGVDELIKIAKYSTTKQRARAMAQRLSAMEVGASDESNRDRVTAE